MPNVTGNPWIEFVEPIYDGQEGTPFRITGERDYTQKYLVQVKDRYVTELVVCTAPYIPRIGMFYEVGSIALDAFGTPRREYEYDLLAVVSEISAQRKEDDPYFWIVTVKYTTRVPPGGPPGLNDPSKQQDDPTAEPPDVSWDFEVAQVALRGDLNDKPFLNSCHEPFTPAPTFEVAYPTLTIARNEYGFNRIKATIYALSVNDKPFIGAPRGCAQCRPPQAHNKWRGKLQYWRVTYKIRFQHLLNDGTYHDWQTYLLDQGLNHIQTEIIDDAGRPRPDFKKAVPIMRGGISPITKPDLLDGMGQPVIPDPTTGTRTPTFLTFETSRYTDFTKLIVKGLA